MVVIWSLRPVSVSFCWLPSADILLVISLKAYFLTKVQACTSSSSLMYLLPLTLLLNACPLIPCHIGHHDFSMLFFSQSRLSLKHLSPKLFLLPQRVAPSKLPDAPSLPPSVLCPWVTSSADVDVIITSMPTTFKILIYC